MKYKVCKLVDGSIVIGTLDRTEEFLCDIMDINLHPNETGGIAIQLIPALYPFNQKPNGINIKTSKILYEIDAPEDLVNNYISATSNIVPASAIPESLKKASGLRLVK